MNTTFPHLLSEEASTQVLIPILLMLGGLGALFIGMNMLQSSTEKLATKGLRKLFAKTANSKLAGPGIGTLATMIMQSSGATTVMVVGFVNAGAMSLAQATTYIMGANIGTTITAQLVALGGLSSSAFPLTEILIALTLLGVVLRMICGKKKPRIALAGDLIAGLGLLFLGLETMTGNMQTLFLSNAELKNFLTSLTNPFLLLCIGILLTVLAQSSSAVTSIVLAMAMAGAVIGGNGNGVLYLILGSNIGSTSTALLSSIGSTTNGKRAAVIHLLFNVFGSLIFFIVLLCWQDAMEMTFAKLFPNNPAVQIAMFHTFFNLICSLLFLPFTRFFVFLSSKIVRGKKEKHKSDILDERFLSTPELALSQAISYYHLTGGEALHNLNDALDAFLAKDKSKQSEIEESEKKVMAMAKELSSFLVAITSAGVSKESSSKISKMQLDIADLLRLSEIADNVAGYTRHEVDDELSFSPIVIEQIKTMKEKLGKMYQATMDSFDSPSSEKLSIVTAYENEIDDLRTAMVSGHLERLEKGICKPQSSNTFLNLVSNLERCGDHLNFIAERSCSTFTDPNQKDAMRP